VPLFKRNEIWWIDLRHRGRRVRRTTGTADKAVAKRQHDELAAKLWKEKQTGRQLSDALVAWLDAKPRNEKALAYVGRIRDEYGDRALIDVTAGSVEETFGHKAAGSYNRYVSIIRAAMNIAKRKEWIESIPHFQRRPEPAGRDRFLTPEEWQRLRAELPEHLQDMADFAIATGLRWANVSLLEWSQVSLPNRQVWILAGQAKGRKAINVPLSDAAIAVLERMQGADLVFVFTYAGRPIESPKTALRKAVVRAGLAGVTWHTFRHTWASWHAQNGTPMEVLQQLGAWQTRDMLDRYAHLSPSHLAQYAGNAATKLVTRPKKRVPTPR